MKANFILKRKNARAYNFYFLIVQFLMLSSCMNDDYKEVVLDKPNNIWEYQGDKSIISKAIEDMKKVPTTTDFVNSLEGGFPLWEKAQSLLINDEPTLLIPIVDHKGVSVKAVIAISYKYHRLRYLTVFREDLQKDKVPKLRSRKYWMSYFQALEKSIFSKKNNSSGFNLKKVSKEEMLISRSNGYDCNYVYAGYDQCFYTYYCDAEENCSEPELIYCERVYRWECWWVEDSSNPPSSDPCESNWCDPECVSYDPLECESGGDGGGGGGGGENSDISYYLTPMDSNDDINSPYDGMIAKDTRGELFQYSSDLDAWLLPHVEAIVTSDGLELFEIRKPAFQSRMLLTLAPIAFAEPTPVGEVVLAGTTIVVAIVYAYDIAVYVSNAKDADRDHCISLYGLCQGRYGYLNMDCGTCLQYCNTQGEWDFLNCPLRG